MSSKQLTLDGTVTNRGRIVPDTFVVCEDCGERVLRSRVRDHCESSGVAAKTFTVQVSLQASFEIDVDPGTITTEREQKKEARRKALDRFQKSGGNIRPEATILSESTSLS